MKNSPWITAAIFVVVAAYSQRIIAQPAQPIVDTNRIPALEAATQRYSVNYLVRVEWKTSKAEAKSLEVLTAEGQFNLNTIEKNPVKINGNDVPTTLKFTGTITPIGVDKARVKLFLGRTVPYITSTTSGSGGGTMSSYQQLSVGLDSTFIIKFGKPVVVQNDESGQVSVLVTRQD